MVRMAPHRGGVARRGIAPEKLRIALSCKGGAMRRNAQQRQSIVKNSIETFGAVYSKGYGWQ